MAMSQIDKKWLSWIIIFVFCFVVLILWELREQRRVTPVNDASSNVGNSHLVNKYAGNTVNFSDEHSVSTQLTYSDIKNFNRFLTHKRVRYLASLKLGNDSALRRAARQFRNSTATREVSPDYFVNLRGYPDVKTYALYISARFLRQGDGAGITWMDGERVRRNQIVFPPVPIFPLTLEQGACELLLLRHRYGGVTNKRLINPDPALCEQRELLNLSLKQLGNSGREVFAEEFLTASDYQEGVFLHVIPNARVSTLGVVLYKDLYIEPIACQTAPEFKDFDKMSGEDFVGGARIVDEVFVSTHKWGMGYFHWNAEAIARLALYLDFLIANKNIKILIPIGARIFARNTLEILGIRDSAKRLIWGKVIGKVIYLPQGPRCGKTTSVYGLNIASTLYRGYIKEHLAVEGSSIQDTIILIHRSKRRYLEQHNETRTMLETIASRSNLKFKVFSDKNLPSFNETMRLFYRAALVVAPHGAGLVNTMFSQPGTVVIEVLCPDRRAVLCYPFLSRNIGHIYHGMRHDKYKDELECVKLWVDLDQLEKVVMFYINEHILAK